LITFLFVAKFFIRTNLLYFSELKKVDWTPADVRDCCGQNSDYCLFGLVTIWTNPPSDYCPFGLVTCNLIY